MPVNADEFVEALHLVVYEAAIEDVLSVLADPPGRRPRPELTELSAWVNDLSGEDRERLGGVIRLAVDHAVFGMMAVLDGVRVIDDEHTELYLRTGDGTLLNEQHDLHDIFRSVIDEKLGHVAPPPGSGGP
jgi:hypothetical protein